MIAPVQSYDCPNASEVTLKDIGKIHMFFTTQNTISMPTVDEKNGDILI